MPQYLLPQSRPDFLQFSPLEFFGSFLALNPALLWIVFLLPAVFFMIVSLVLSYHWKRFGLDMAVMAKASLLYFSVSSALLVIMMISLGVYLNSL